MHLNYIFIMPYLNDSKECEMKSCICVYMCPHMLYTYQYNICIYSQIFNVKFGNIPPNLRIRTLLICLVSRNGMQKIKSSHIISWYFCYLLIGKAESILIKKATTHFIKHDYSSIFIPLRNSGLPCGRL